MCGMGWLGKRCTSSAEHLCLMLAVMAPRKLKVGCGHHRVIDGSRMVPKINRNMDLTDTFFCFEG